MTEVARISYYSPRLRESSERKLISGAQRRRLPTDMLWRPLSDVAQDSLRTDLALCGESIEMRCDRA